MNIQGLQKTTLLDYPEHVAATVFMGGCNFRCPFCHNGGLVLTPQAYPAMQEEEVLGYLRKRAGVLEGVCITGGEPTLQPGLADFLMRIKELGYLIKLDTNGYAPHVLKELLDKQLLDYVAMDIKASREGYARAAGLEQMDLGRIEESIRVLQESGIAYEFRTTVVKGLHTIEEMDAIGRWLAGSRAYYLQNYRENDQVIALTEGACADGGNRCGLCGFEKKELEEMAALAGRYIERVEIRGVD